MLELPWARRNSRVRASLVAWQGKVITLSFSDGARGFSPLSIYLIFVLLILPIADVYGWSNGAGYSTCVCNPVIGTHDWIAQKAVELLPAGESPVFDNNMNWLRYGTELPDKPNNMSGYGDSFNHHVYFDEEHRVTDDAAARRADDCYQDALNLLKKGNFSGGVMVAGATSHYIADVAVWGHSMGEYTPWGNETHHQDYEAYVSDHQSLFDLSIAPMNPINRTSAYQATLDLASNIMFVVPNATWMDTHYNWSDPQFKARVTLSLNLAVNYVANVFHTLWLDAGQPLPEFSTAYLPTIVAVAVILMASRKYKATSLSGKISRPSSIAQIEAHTC